MGNRWGAWYQARYHVLTWYPGTESTELPRRQLFPIAGMEAATAPASLTVWRTRRSALQMAVRRLAFAVLLLARARQRQRQELLLPAADVIARVAAWLQHTPAVEVVARCRPVMSDRRQMITGTRTVAVDVEAGEVMLWRRSALNAALRRMALALLLLSDSVASQRPQLDADVISCVAARLPDAVVVRSRRQLSAQPQPAAGRELSAAAARDGDDERRFAFDRVYGRGTQARIFDDVGRPVVDAVLDGRSGCIFAYGQTGSGKSYTMFGATRSPDPAGLGIVPRAFERVFQQCHDACAGAGAAAAFTVHGSMVAVHGSMGAKVRGALCLFVSDTAAAGKTEKLGPFSCR
eukprot:SAG11_NODE_2301_length_3548_cov_5.628298_1_plen_349_part_00